MWAPIRALAKACLLFAGIMNIPLCDDMATKSRWNPIYWACLSMQRLMHWGATMPWVRDNVVQAQYFRVILLPFALSKTCLMSVNERLACRKQKPVKQPVIEFLPMVIDRL